MTYPWLAGCRVIESSAFIAAPLCGMTLAQYGADVIRVDPIGGGIDYRRQPLRKSGRSLYWTGLNKQKRSLALDFRSAEGRDILLALITAPGEGALLTNVGSPWLSHQRIAALRPDAITCTIEGSSDGRTAVDYTVNCATGYPYVTGAGDRPINHVLPAWDVICAQHAAFALCAAFFKRRAGGGGSEVRIALSDVAFSTLSHLGVIAEAELERSERPAIGNDLFGALGRDFSTADGRRVMIAAISLKQWQALQRACGIGEAARELEQRLGLDFRDESQRFVARAELFALIEFWCRARTFAELRETFDREGVCWGEYLRPIQLVDADPRVSLSNPIFETLDTPGVGRHRAAGATARIAGEAREAGAPAPWLGQHTDQILSETLGFSARQIAELHDRGVVAGPERDPFWAAT